MSSWSTPYSVYKESGIPWLHKIPADWATITLKRITSMKSGESITAQSIDEIGRYPVYGGNGLRGFTDAYTHDGTFILIGRQGALCGNVHLVHGSFWASEHAVVTTVRGANDPEWLSYLLTTMNLNQYSESAAQPGISVEKIENLKVPFPNPDQQHTIATILNAAERGIKRLIRNKRRLIRLLREQKQAIINQAVTRGIDPNVPLKPSGIPVTTNISNIPWLSSVPDHWKIVPAKRLFSVREERARPDDKQLSATQAYGVILQEEFERLVGRRVVKIFTHLEKRRHVEVNDFVISMRSFQGGLERAWDEGCIRSSYVVLEPSIALDADFFQYLFKSNDYIQALRATSNFIRDGQDLNFHNFNLVDLPLLPLGEQRSIASYLKETTKKIDTTISRAEREVVLMNEYRTRLISDVVTGKVDVRDVVINDDEELKDSESDALDIVDDDEDMVTLDDEESMD